jgi:hypothetical protein
MTSTAVGFSRESFFCGTAGPVILLCCWGLFTSSGVNIEGAELLAALPAPGFTAASSYRKGAPSLQTTCKDIVTCGILQCPALTPRTLLCICRHSLMCGA